MSQVYATEPQTSGSVVFETTHGPLSIHLWCKECPHTVRFFLQLCLDGFYDGLIFHRIIPNFLIQTGDPQYRQKGDVPAEDEESAIYRQPLPNKYRQKHEAPQALERRQYELNSRIRFNHRGQIAMALGTDDNDDNDSQSLARLQPQFFITLDEASHLDGKHVCFGGITGPTIFNALRIGQADIVNDANDDVRNFQPRILSEAPRILRTKILEVDLPPTLPALAPTQDASLLPWRIDPKSSGTKGAKDPKKRKKKNRKGVKNINLLSFGEEMNEEDGEENKASAKGMKSSHDVLTSKSLSKKKTEIKSSEIADTNTSVVPLKPSVPDSHDPPPTKKSEPPKSTTENLETKESVAPSEPPNPTFSSRKDRTEAKQTSEPPPALTEPKKKKKDKTKKISLVEARRAKYAKKNSNRKGSTKQAREDETMAKFKAFQKKLTVATAGGNGEKEAAVYHGQVLEQQENDNSGDWIKTEFKCKRHMDQDAKARGGDGRGADDYEVIEERSSATERKPGKRKRYRQDI